MAGVAWPPIAVLIERVLPVTDPLRSTVMDLRLYTCLLVECRHLFMVIPSVGLRRCMRHPNVRVLRYIMDTRTEMDRSIRDIMDQRTLHLRRRMPLRCARMRRQALQAAGSHRLRSEAVCMVGLAVPSRR